jgi:hypothetical protein
VIRQALARPLNLNALAAVFLSNASSIRLPPLARVVQIIRFFANVRAD